MTLLVKPGDKVYTGQNIAFMGGALGMPGAGDSTGCHLHFEVVGARNPLASYPIGSTIVGWILIINYLIIQFDTTILTYAP